MRFWRRRSAGRHALGAAVTGIPSWVPQPVVTAVPVPMPRTAVAPPVLAPADHLAQAADRSALTATQPQPTTPATACAPVSSALEHALVDLLLVEEVSERQSFVVAPRTAQPTPVVMPSVQLGFRDGSTVELDPGSPHARSLQTLARALTTLA